jgi:hypothetical protein
VRRWTRPIQPSSSSTGHTLVASTTAETFLVARYESQTTKPSQLVFRALLGGDRKVRFERFASR